MTAAEGDAGRGGAGRIRAGAAPSSWRAYALPVALAITVGLMVAGDGVPWAATYSSGWVVPVDVWVGGGAKWLLREAHIGSLLVRDVTRAVGAALEAPVSVLQAVLVGGIRLGVADGQPLVLGPLSWLGVVAFFTALALGTGDRRLAVLAALTFISIAVVGLWESAMLTLALVVVAVAYGVFGGLVLGILAYRHAWVRAVTTPALDFMQTVPVFGYLVPALLLFGYSPAAALLITLIYALPPMARVTTNALLQSDPETMELGRMTGCSPGQLLHRVLLPSQRPRLMLGVNQVIMLTLNMVIISSLIGAGGLGYDVWQALKALHIGKGAEAGLAITMLAIVLDRLSQRYASRRPDHTLRAMSFAIRYRHPLGGIGVTLVLTFAAAFVPELARYPTDWIVTSGRFWDGVVDWINIHAYDGIRLVRDALFLYVLRPAKEFALALPWPGVVLLVGAFGVRLGGARLGVALASLVLFIAVVGQWEKAMISTYLVGIALLISCLAGVPLGMLAARRDWLHRVLEPVIDTLQTLPSFVYLIPVVMLFSVGDFSALVAIVLYAVAPAIRYTEAAIRQVPSAPIEAARAFGASSRQIDRRVVVPLAFPDIVLGINQTLMLGLSMLVITALVGTRDLGQETLIALSKSDPGRGLVAGVCVAFIAICADRLLRAWARRRRATLGLATEAI